MREILLESLRISFKVERFKFTLFGYQKNHDITKSPKIENIFYVLFSPRRQSSFIELF